MPDSQSSNAWRNASSRHRVSKVCARCKQRKIKCDSQLPVCGSCQAAGVECKAYNSRLGQEVPRSLVRHLEDEISRLEEQVGESYRDDSTTDGDPISRVTKSISFSGVPSSGSFFSSFISECVFSHPSCPPLVVERERLSPTPNEDGINTSPQQDGKSSPPRTTFNFNNLKCDTIKEVVNLYTTFHIHQYPIITQPWLDSIVAKILAQKSRDGKLDVTWEINTPGIANIECFVFFIILAISSLALIWQREPEARSASQCFFSLAMRYLRHCGEIDEIERLEISLLLAHYAHMNPAALDIWACVANATRIVLALNLHKKCPDYLPLEQKGIRSRLFWVTYGMERLLCAMLRLPLSFAEESIEVELEAPADVGKLIDMETNAETRRQHSAYHLYLYRKLETEVHRVMHLFHDTYHLRGMGLLNWISDITSRLDQWYHQSQQYFTYGVLEFRHVQYNYLKAKIHRPTPRLPHRHLADQQVCVDTCVRIIESVQDAADFRILFYPWQGTHILFGAAVILLDAVWHAGQSVTNTSRAEHILLSTIPVCIELMEDIGNVWSAAKDCARSARSLLDEVVASFGLDSRSSPELRHFDPNTARKIQKLLFADRPLVINS